MKKEYILGIDFPAVPPMDCFCMLIVLKTNFRDEDKSTVLISKTFRYKYDFKDLIMLNNILSEWIVKLKQDFNISYLKVVKG